MTRRKTLLRAMSTRRDEHTYRGLLYSGYAKNFQDTGTTFDARAARRWAKAYCWYLRGWLPGTKDAAIVELGCGGGRLLYYLCTLGYTNVRGVDISPDQVALARQVVPTLDEADTLEWLAASQERYDLLIALDLIEHFRKEEALRFLDLCFSALKPGGRLIVQTPNMDSPLGLQIRYGDYTHELGFNTDLLARLLRRAGFVSVELREQGPVPLGYSAVSSLRWLVWQAIRRGVMVWNLAETGSTPCVLTRVFLATGKHP
jgi:2-polyprenyl-3-methyl-5-hydroxy-6-metoxy-1,4-benzoquinol methylase